MRRILYITLAIAFIFSMCAVPVSAESYDLSDPVLWYTAHDDAYSIYFPYNDNTESYLPSYSGQIDKYFAYYDKTWINFWESYNMTPIWTQGSLLNFSDRFEVMSNRHTGNQNVLVSCFRGNVRNSFLIPGFRFSGVYLPEDGQYLKISFSLSAQQYSPVPDESFLNYQNLFFLLPHSMQNQVFSPGVVPPTTVIRTRSSVTNVTSYEVYFDMNNLAFDQYGDQYTQEPFDLVVRIPYYFPDTEYYDSQVLMASDVSFPTSYEIVTVGGYQNAIQSVENAVIAGFDELDKTLTEVDPGDTIIITELDQTFDKLDYTISDYDDAMQPVFQMKELYTHPPVANIIQSNTSNLDTADVKDFLSLPWIISAFSMIFAFCIIRLILFGTKEG